MPSVGDAFEAYYVSAQLGPARCLSVPAATTGRWQVLNAGHTAYLLRVMERVQTGKQRIRAGLPRTAFFIHKTGTQQNRACQMGVINQQDGAHAAIVVATCAEDLDEHGEAGRSFEQIGRAIT